MTTHVELAQWLEDNGYAESRRGYGHVTGEDLAAALLAKFTITDRSDGSQTRTRTTLTMETRRVYDEHPDA